MPMSRRWRAGIAVLAMGFVLGATTVVVAAGPPNRGTGKTIDSVKVAVSNGPFEFTGPDGATKNVPGARHRLTATKDSTLFLARFTATIDCTGDPGRCSAFVKVLDNNNNHALVTTMSGVFHIDSTFSGGHESHTAESFVTLGVGDYDFQVEILLNHCCGGTGTFTANIPTWIFTLMRVP
jgi:hypothetical protein